MAINEHKKKRLAQAMKQNIARRKETDQDDSDIDQLKQKIANFQSVEKPLTPRQRVNPSEILGYVIDLFAGGLVGFIIGLVFSVIFNCSTPVLKIVFMALGLMGGFYNIYKHSSANYIIKK